jgi:hypothetical protein
MVNKLSQKNQGNGIELVSRVQPKYHFPINTKMLERQLRISLGLPFIGKMGGQVAYGYVYNESNDTYEPIPEIFTLLWQARQYLFTSSLREVADWLNYKTEKAGYTSKVSHMGLRNIMILRPPFEESQLPIEEREKLIESICQFNLQKTTI